MNAEVIFNKITNNGMREMTLLRFIEAIEELEPYIARSAANNAYSEGWDKCMSYPYQLKKAMKDKYLNTHHSIK